MSPEKKPVLERDDWGTFQTKLESFSDEEKINIYSAFWTAQKGFGNQRRLDGEKYITHLIGTTLILIEECKIKGVKIACAALLHDTPEDTSPFGNPKYLSPTDFSVMVSYLIAKHYYPETAEMVLALTEPYVDGVIVKDKTQAKAIKYEKLRNASEEALLVKMADRLHNLRTFYPKEGQKTPERKMKETEEILIPIFERAAGKYPAETQYLLAEINKAILALKAKAQNSGGGQGQFSA